MLVSTPEEQISVLAGLVLIEPGYCESDMHQCDVQLTAAAGRCKLPAVLCQSVTHFCEDSVLLQKEAPEGLAQPCRCCLLILYLLKIVALDVVTDIFGLRLIQIQVEVRQIVIKRLHRRQSGIAEEDLLVGVLQQAPVGYHQQIIDLLLHAFLSFLPPFFFGSSK